MRTLIKKDDFNLYVWNVRDTYAVRVVKNPTDGIVETHLVKEIDPHSFMQELRSKGFSHF